MEFVKILIFISGYIQLEFVKILIFITVDIFSWNLLKGIYSNTQPKKKKKIKRADKKKPEVYGATLKRAFL